MGRPWLPLPHNERRITMQYTDKNGNEIKDGMMLRLSDGTVERVYKTVDESGNDDLGINASNEEYLLAHGLSEADREFYPLSQFPQNEFEIIEPPVLKDKDSMWVLIVEPMKKPYMKEIPCGLESMQSVVGGYIQAVYPFEDNVAVVCNEEGKLMGLPPNRYLRDDRNVPYDVICGTFFVAGLSEDSFTSLTKEQAAIYSNMYSKEMLISIPKDKKPKQHER